MCRPLRFRRHDGEKKMRLLTAAEDFARPSNRNLFAIALPTTVLRKCPR